MASFTLSQESQASLSAAAGFDLLSLPLEDLRALADRSDPAIRGDFVFPGFSEEQNIPSVDGGEEYNVPVTILRPEGNVWDKIMVFFHGGGWVWGSRKSHRKICEIISCQSNCVVVNVEYRLSPEFKFPACYTDAKAVVRWVMDNRQELANNESAKVGVAGDSAGGGIAASVCHIVDGVDYQILIYPSLTMAGFKDYPSYKKYGKGFLLSDELIDWFHNHFLRSKEDENNILCCPLNRTSLTGLPPALFIVAECDPLADQSEDYQGKLEAAGVHTTSILLRGTLHGCINKPGAYKETLKPAIESITKFLGSL